MEKFEVHILGCGSALPTTRHNPSSQIINLRDKLYMIDCGEGTQLQMRKAGQKFTRLSHIFISHLHGDHCFGLIGLISTFSLLGRTADLHIHAPQELESVLQCEQETFCRELGFEVIFHAINPKEKACIWEDRSLTVETIPLRHRIACCGFLFKEKPTLPHIKRDMIDFYNIPVYAIQDIKEGADWITAEGKEIPNAQLVTPADAPRTYAYCSDTLYMKSLAEKVKGATVLYHEATFGQDNLARAKETLHSTAAQAAQVALDANVKQLIIGHYSARYTDEQPLLKEAQSIFSHTILAKEGLCVEVK